MAARWPRLSCATSLKTSSRSIWRARTGVFERELGGLAGPVRALAFAPEFDAPLEDLLAVSPHPTAAMKPQMMIIRRY